LLLSNNKVLVTAVLYIKISNIDQKIIAPKLYIGNQLIKHKVIPTIIAGINTNIIDRTDLLYALLISIQSLIVFFNMAQLLVF